MLDLFIEGGVLFMGMLTIVFLAIFTLAIRSIILVTKSEQEISILNSQIGYIKSLGLFGLVLGFLGQFLGLFSAFDYIAAKGSIAPEILAAGFKVSSISSIYGMIIFLIAYLCWFALTSFLRNKIE